MEKIKNFIKETPKDIIIKFECDKNGNELIFKMLDRYDSDWPNEPWESTTKMMFEKYFDDNLLVLEIPYDEFITLCPYSETWIKQLYVSKTEESHGVLYLYLADI